MSASLVPSLSHLTLPPTQYPLDFSGFASWLSIILRSRSLVVRAVFSTLGGCIRHHRVGNRLLLDNVLRVVKWPVPATNYAAVASANRFMAAPGPACDHYRFILVYHCLPRFLVDLDGIVDMISILMNKRHRLSRTEKDFSGGLQ